MRALRRTIRGSVPPGYVERYEKGRFLYEILLGRYPRTYNGRPLCLAMVAVRKNFVSLYLMAVFGDQGLAKWFREAGERSGKTLHMGKSCVHFGSLNDIPFDVVEKAIRAVPVERLVKSARAPAVARAASGAPNGQKGAAIWRRCFLFY